MAEEDAIDVYQYDIIPSKLRQQILYVFEDNCKLFSSHYWSNSPIWQDVVDVMRRELGVPRLTKSFQDGNYNEFRLWFSEHSTLEDILDTIEVYFEFATGYCKAFNYGRNLGKMGESINLLNARFREAGVGYQLEGRQIIKISSQHMHSEVIVPALTLLSNPKFKSANEEYRAAHAKYRAGSYEDCLTDCCKAFESVLKVIGAELGWSLPQNATAKALIQAAYSHELVPSYMQNAFTGLRSILEGGVPTLRNKTSGHGRGTDDREVPVQLAEFQLHQTAAAIIFLVKQANL